MMTRRRVPVHQRGQRPRCVLSPLSRSIPTVSLSLKQRAVASWPRWLAHAAAARASHTLDRRIRAGVGGSVSGMRVQPSRQSPQDPAAYLDSLVPAEVRPRAISRRLRCTAAAMLALSLAGCSSNSSSGARPSATATVTVTTTQPPSPTEATSGSSSNASGSQSPSVSQVLRMTHQGTTYFETPSGNITCFLLWYGRYRRVECGVREKEFADPPRPADCGFDWVPQFTLGEDSSYGACRSDANGNPTNTVLRYGGTALNGPLTCKSETTGLSCANNDTDHGFTISRATYRIF